MAFESNPTEGEGGAKAPPRDPKGAPRAPQGALQPRHAGSQFLASAFVDKNLGLAGLAKAVQHHFNEHLDKVSPEGAWTPGRQGVREQFPQRSATRLQSVSPPRPFPLGPLFGATCSYGRCPRKLE